jgi:hypothetical protein
MLAFAEDVRGEAAVRPVVDGAGVTFPVLLDPEGRLAGVLGFRIVPSGFFVDAANILRYRHYDDFDIADARVRQNLERFLAGLPVEAVDEEQRMVPEALELFASGVAMIAEGREREAVAIWRRALRVDPENFVIRSQIWAVEHPEHFYPVVDREWQAQQLLKEGYDGPLP